MLISATEIVLNDLPVLPVHMPMSALVGCAFSLNVLWWYTHHGRFTYLYGEPSRSSSAAMLVACVATPLALPLAFGTLASISSAMRVRDE